MHLFHKTDNGLGYRAAILWQDSSISLLHQTGESGLQCIEQLVCLVAMVLLLWYSVCGTFGGEFNLTAWQILF